MCLSTGTRALLLKYRYSSTAVEIPLLLVLQFTNWLWGHEELIRWSVLWRTSDAQQLHVKPLLPLPTLPTNDPRAKNRNADHRINSSQPGE